MWFLWPLCIWGVFVLWNFIEVFVLDQVVSEKSAIAKEVEKIKRGKQYTARAGIALWI
jgi:hypothetical protein